MIEISMLASHVSAVERRGSAFVAASSSRPPPLAVRYSGPVLAHSLTICQKTTECLLWRLVCPERVLVKQLPSEVNALCGTASMPFPLCMWNYPVVCSRVLVEVRGVRPFSAGARSKCVTLCRPDSPWHNCSDLLLPCRSSHRQYGSARTWLCSREILFAKTGNGRSVGRFGPWALGRRTPGWTILI